MTIRRYPKRKKKNVCQYPFLWGNYNASGTFGPGRSPRIPWVRARLGPLVTFRADI